MSTDEEFAHLKFELKKIVEATNNFAKEIGQGGFGKTYEGNLFLFGKPTVIAARRLHYDYGQGDLEFWNEISTLASVKLKHDNLVSFIGFCDEEGEKIIIYKHEVNRSLDKYLSSTTLKWMQRLHICVDIARALNYLHCDDGHESSVIHRNIKSSKILLDENWRAKLCGFEHSKRNTRARRHRLVVAEVIGTIGYVDPTYEKTGFVTHKSDVYSFGVVLFEVLCGKKAFIPDETAESPQHFTEGKLEESLPSPESVVGEPLLFDDGTPSSLVEGRPSPSVRRRRSPFVEGRPSSFVEGRPSSFSEGRASSIVDGPHSSPDSSERRAELFIANFYQELGINKPTHVPAADPPVLPRKNYPIANFYLELGINRPIHLPAADPPVLPRKDYSVKEHRFILQPVYTMKRLDRYSHSPHEELLAELAKSHYDEENLDDIIDPALKNQMDPKSFKIFTEIAYNCLKEKRVQRPNIDQILRNLERALELQMRHENPEDSLVAAEDEGTTLNRREEEHWKHLKIPLTDIEAATKNFTEIYLGSGGYADVYRAELKVPLEGKTKGKFSRKWRTVAIKRIRQDRQGKEGFNVEIELLTSCKHTNIVSLLGFCDEGSNLILVYEHASNRSLDDYLGTASSSTNLTWVQRIKIGIDIACGLNYIHTRVEDEQRIVHRDIKSANILLTKSWVAKIADFGLSRFHGADLEEKSVVTRNVAGTEYYVCPEYAKNGRLRTSVDIYSFGVVLFEILSGKLAYDPIYVAKDKSGIACIARQRYMDRTLHEMVDPKIMEEVDELTSTVHKGPNQDSLKAYSEIAHRCVAITQDDRPTAKEILEELEKALSLQEKNKDNLQVSFEEIKLSTQDFSRANLIGGGGFGKVFRGELIRGNGSTTIVAKRLDRSHGQGEHHFLTELEILFEYKHDNIIGLEGYCNEYNEKIIVYEHACNGSLDRHLNNINLTWSKRLKICIDIARGLAFLHGCALTKEIVIHRDIKSANVLLNSDWKAKISDFGLSAIIPRNEKAVSKLVGTIGYVDPEYNITGFFTEKSDIYSLGVVLFEILNGELLVPNTKDYNEWDTTIFISKIHGDEDFEWIVFKDIKEQIDPQSLSTFRMIVRQCLSFDRRQRPTAELVLQQLEKSLEFQEVFEIWRPKFPEDYEEILKLSKSPGISYPIENKKDIYNVFAKGILLQDEKVWFSLGSNGERNEMISATTFSYRNSSPHDHELCTVSESRFEKVAEMLDISNLMIKIETRPQFLSPNTIYGVHLVFKFCDSSNVSRNPMYVDLKYKMGSKTLHAYFAKWRDEEWMTIELYRFLNQNEDVNFKFLLNSLSPYYCRDHDSIYVEGIEFRAINNVEHDETAKVNEIQQVTRSNSNFGEGLQILLKRIFWWFLNNIFLNHQEFSLIKVLKRTFWWFFSNFSLNHLQFSLSEVLKRVFWWLFNKFSLNHPQFSVSEVNGNRHLMILAKPALYNRSDFGKAGSRFQEVFEFVPPQVLRISCTIKSETLSPDTEYACYLVFKLSIKCHGLHNPVEVRDLLHKNILPEIVYFRSPNPWNIHDITRLCKRRKDGWMEVKIWNFNSSHELKNDCILVNLKLISYEGSISGLNVCGLEFRSM